MLSSPNFSDSRQSEVRLQEEPAVATVFPAMLRFLYSGRITITHATVLPTLVLADKYNIKASVGGHSRTRVCDYRECGANP